MMRGTLKMLLDLGDVCSALWLHHGFDAIESIQRTNTLYIVFLLLINIKFIKNGQISQVKITQTQAKLQQEKEC